MLKTTKWVSYMFKVHTGATNVQVSECGSSSGDDSEHSESSACARDSVVVSTCSPSSPSP